MDDRLKQAMDKATDYSGSKSRKFGKGVLGVVILLLLGALGLEATETDFDLGKLLGGSSLEESKVDRDEKGNVVYYDKEGNTTKDATAGKKASDYNCDDFSTQTEAQKFMVKVGADDLYRLDGDKDGEACEGLPKGTN